ncbi:MAG: hypothetical protein WCP20_07300 [Desulfuromonadales bacterium]
MRAIIPDTLEGALILSVIDFFLSFVIIAGIGVILSFFPLLNRFSSKNDDSADGHDPRLVPSDRAESPAINAHHLVAISAAIHEVMGSHRIISVESSRKVELSGSRENERIIS